MAVILETGIPCIEENEATGEVARLYDEVKSVMQVPQVPNIVKAMAISLPAVSVYWSMVNNFITSLTLPKALVAMISYTIAMKNQCKYCSAGHELSCRLLGIDEVMLNQLVEDLGNVSPERVRAIIEFAIKVAKNPKELVAADYENLRQQGVTNNEIVEIILVSGSAFLGDILAESLKVEVDDIVTDGLAR